MFEVVTQKKKSYGLYLALLLAAMIVAAVIAGLFHLDRGPQPEKRPAPSSQK